MDDVKSDDFVRMREFFYSLGISGATSNSCAMLLVGPLHNTASPLKLARKISWRQFNLADVGLDDLDAEAVEKTLRRDYPEVFNVKEVIAPGMRCSPATKSGMIMRSSSPSVPSGAQNASRVLLQKSPSNPKFEEATSPRRASSGGRPIDSSDSAKSSGSKSSSSRSASGKTTAAPKIVTAKEVAKTVPSKVLSKIVHKKKTITMSGKANSVIVEEPKSLTDVLSKVTGKCIVNLSDLSCEGLGYRSAGAPNGFPSVGCKNYPVSKGKWYFEVDVTSGGAQVGLADSEFVGGEAVGVGDDSHSWAHDGLNKLHLGRDFGNQGMREWCEDGGVIGVSIDLDSTVPSMIFHIIHDDGKGNNSNSAFSRFEFSEYLYPCVSFDERESVRFNFGTDPFSKKIPKGYLPYCDNIIAQGGDAGDVTTRFNSRSCDGLRLQNLTRGHATTCLIKEEKIHSTKETVKKQWLDILAKMADLKEEMFTAEMCKTKPLISSKGNKRYIAYNFKQSGKGWCLGRMHNKTMGAEKIYFNYICDFDKVRQAYFLDEKLYFDEHLSSKENGANDAANMAWVIFGKDITRKRQRLSGDFPKGDKRDRKRKTLEPNVDFDAAAPAASDGLYKSGSVQSQGGCVRFASDNITWEESEVDDLDNQDEEDVEVRVSHKLEEENRGDEDEADSDDGGGYGDKDFEHGRGKKNVTSEPDLDSDDEIQSVDESSKYKTAASLH